MKPWKAGLVAVGIAGGIGAALYAFVPIQGPPYYGRSRFQLWQATQAGVVPKEIMPPTPTIRSPIEGVDFSVVLHPASTRFPNGVWGWQCNYDPTHADGFGPGIMGTHDEAAAQAAEHVRTAHPDKLV